MIRWPALALAASLAVAGTACTTGGDGRRAQPAAADRDASGPPGSAATIHEFVRAARTAPAWVGIDVTPLRSPERIRALAQGGVVSGSLVSARIGVPHAVAYLTPPGPVPDPLQPNAASLVGMDLVLGLRVEESTSARIKPGTTVEVAILMWTGQRDQSGFGKRSIEEAVRTAPIGARVVAPLADTASPATALLGTPILESPDGRAAPIGPDEIVATDGAAFAELRAALLAAP